MECRRFRVVEEERDVGDTRALVLEHDARELGPHAIVQLAEARTLGRQPAAERAAGRAERFRYRLRCH